MSWASIPKFLAHRKHKKKRTNWKSVFWLFPVVKECSEVHYRFCVFLKNRQVSFPSHVHQKKLTKNSPSLILQKKRNVLYASFSQIYILCAGTECLDVKDTLSQTPLLVIKKNRKLLARKRKKPVWSRRFVKNWSIDTTQVESNIRHLISQIETSNFVAIILSKRLFFFLLIRFA